MSEKQTGKVSPKPSNFVIGLCGRFGAGCTTTANLIISEYNDFTYFSLSQYIKDKAKKEVLGFENKLEKEKRIILQDIGDSLRKKSPAFLVKVILANIQEALNKKNVIVDSIRNNNEVEALRNNFSRFFLLAIDASTESRWRRLERLYNNDKNQFETDDKRDAGGEDEPDNGQQVKKCMELADVLINNDRDYSEKFEKIAQDPIEEYGQKVKRYIELIKKPGYKDPNFDELFMHHAYSFALRSICRKRQVGAVIIRESEKAIPGKPKPILEKFMVSSGCNNVPLAVSPCGFEKGPKDCYRDLTKDEYINNSKYCRSCGKILARSSKKIRKCKECGEKIWNNPGRILDLCRSIHAEEAAIIQAAKLGTPIDGTILYTSTFPCLLCAKKVIGAGIREVVYSEPYPMKESLEMLKECGIVMRKYEGVNSRAFIRLFMREIDD